MSIYTVVQFIIVYNLNYYKLMFSNKFYVFTVTFLADIFTFSTKLSPIVPTCMAPKRPQGKKSNTISLLILVKLCIIVLYDSYGMQI